MSKLIIAGLVTTLFMLGACSTKSSEQAADLAKLGNLELCKSYSGLPKDWLKNPHAGMVKIQGGDFLIGNNEKYPEEKSLVGSKKHIEDFWIDQTEVTNAEFRSFVDTTGYKTEAEQQGEAAVFVKPEQQVADLKWWKLEKGYDWKHPWGANSTRKVLENEPVRYVTIKDAMAYAAWLGREIPTEEQWEYAAKAFSHERDVEAVHDGHHPDANVWQGEFPYNNQTTDGFEDVAPVGCFKANGFGLHDMIGNVWELTQTPFSGTHDDHLGVQEQLDPKHLAEHSSYTIKGGSYLCASNYCARYRAASRQPQEYNLAISHVGFRTVKNATP